MRTQLQIGGSLERQRTKCAVGRIRQRGATMVEFALFFILFLLLTLGLMELSRGVWTFTTLSHAARQGARFAMVFRSVNGGPATDTDIKNVVQRHAVGLDLDLNKIDVNWEKLDTSVDPPVWVADTEKDPGSIVEIRVRHTFQLVTGALILSRNIELGSVSRANIAN